MSLQEEIIGNSIKELMQEYDENECSYLTENDVICKLYSILTRNCNPKEFRIHSELRPFYESVENQLVITEEKGGKIGWYKQQTAKSGFRVDLSLINPKTKFFEALEKAKKDQHARSGELKYWRMLSYPVEAFHAIIEVKIKVYRNKTIDKDIEKLVMIRDKNKDCQLYLIILDRKSNPDILKIYKKKAENHNIKYYTFPNVDC